MHSRVQRFYQHGYANPLMVAYLNSRHIHKKIFRFFEPFRVYLQSKFTKSANKSKKNFSCKNPRWVLKNAEFHADFESVVKSVEKMHTQIFLGHISTF
jgi:hypothetical protein